MNSLNSQIADTSDREILLTRVLDAPRELVFKVWTTPEHVAQWWGPRGFTATVHDLDLRPGGTWNFIMHAPDGTDFVNRVEYIEVVPPERLVYWHGGGEDDPSDPFHVTITFDDEGGKTRLTMKSVFSTVEQFEFVKGFGAIELGQQTLECLAAYLEEQGSTN